MSALPAILRRRRRTGGEGYSVLGFRPDLVFDFDAERYRTSGSDTTFSPAITHARASNATMVDGDGVLKWAPHNLIAYSEFEGATVGVVGSGGALPTGWEFSAALDTVEVVEISTHNGQPAIRIRIALDNTGGGATTRAFRRSFASPISVAEGEVYTTAANVNILSNNGSSQDIIHVKSTSGGAFVTATTVTFSGSGWQVVSVESDDMEATVAQLRPYVVSFTVDAALDFEAEFWISAPRTYRSDLGGMVNNPDTGTDYVPNSTGSALYLPRRGHHTWDGSQWVNKGILHESTARTNLVVSTEPLATPTNASWSSGATTSPDGTSNAFELIEDNSTGAHQAISSFTVSADTIYTASFFIKAGTGSDRAVRIQYSDNTFTDGVRLLFNPMTGAIATSETFGAGSNLSTNVQDFSNGWYRVSLSGKVNAASTDTRLVIYLQNNLTSFVASYTGNGTSGVYFYGTQFEAVTAANPHPSSYIPTYGNTATREAETLTIPAANLPWPTPNVIGSELVTNGTFDNDISGWTDASSAGGSASWNAGGYVDIINTTGTARFNQTNLSGAGTTGKVFRLTFDVVAGSTGTGSLYVTDDGSGNGNLIAQTITTDAGPREFFFVSQNDDLDLSFRNFNTGTTFSIDNVSVREISPRAVSISMEGEVSFADSDEFANAYFYFWRADVNNEAYANLRTSEGTAGNGVLNFWQNVRGVQDNSKPAVNIPEGVNVPFAISARHGSTFIQGAQDGTAAAADVTPPGLPDLSSADVLLGHDGFNGTIASFRIWNEDIGETGIEEASNV